MKKYTQEFKVGLFIILCLAGLAYLTLSTGKISFKKEGYNIYVIFEEIAGLDKKAPVMMNGFEVGKVDDMKISYDADKTLVILKLWLDKDTRIRENSEISIKTLGLMGEKFIQISSAQNNSFLEPGITIYGKPYVDIDSLLSDVNSIVGENKERITNIAKNFEEFSDDIKRHPWKLLFKGKETKPKPSGK
ncbi:MAG: MlaD family protein [Candidatus Omnitrophota bacterium]